MDEKIGFGRAEITESRKVIIEAVKNILLKEKVREVFIGKVGISITLCNGKRLFFEDKEDTALDTS